MKQLIRNLINAVKAALANDPDNVEVVAKLKAELAAALTSAKTAQEANAVLRQEAAELEELKPEIDELIELAGKATPAPATDTPPPAETTAAEATEG